MKLMASSRYIALKKAIENEIQIDKYLFDKMKYERKSLIFKVLRFSDKIDFKLYFVFIFFIPFIFLFLFCYFFILSLKLRKLELTTKNFFSFSASPKIKSLGLKSFEGINYIECVKGRQLYFLKNLSFLSLFKNMILSCFYYFLLIVKIKPKYLLHLSSLYELNLFYDFLVILKKNSVKDIYLSNHYDRWLTLISETNFFQIHIVQHGSINDVFFVKNKILNVCELKCFNSEQERIFLNNILVSKPEKISFIECSLSILFDDFCDVLIISSPFHVDREIEVYRLLKLKYNVCFRPHPLFVNNLVIDNINQEDLCLKERFPNPKICICRESTLGVEYESMGYKVVWWDDQTNFSDL